MENSIYIPRQLIVEINTLFLQKQWEDKSNFLLALLEITIKLAKKSVLSRVHLSKELNKVSSDFFIYNEISKDNFIAIFFHLLKSLLIFLFQTQFLNLIHFLMIPNMRYKDFHGEKSIIMGIHWKNLAGN